MQANPIRTDKYIQFAKLIIGSYDGIEPFHLFLKKYFAKNRKHGSRDRKSITRFCYLYFRLGKAVRSNISFEEKIQLAIFLCENVPDEYLELHQPEWNRNIGQPLELKLQMVVSFFNPLEIFSWNEFLSQQINVTDWNTSFLKQPNLFIRTRPGKRNQVIGKVEKAGISFQEIGNNTLVFSPNVKLNDVLLLDNEAVVQDYNSQRIGELLEKYVAKTGANIFVWDCCAASGGKSILAKDILENINLTVSDKRKGILKNLSDRLHRAGIQQNNSFIADLSGEKNLPISKNKFDLIIADVPCSGSGTWVRTPEWLHFFKTDEINRYAALQRKIVQTIFPYLKPDGKLLYITCSVFREENENNIAYFESELDVEILQSNYYIGCEMQADTLFATMLVKK